MRTGNEVVKGAATAIVGEAWGEQEELLRAPFQGSSGAELRRMLRQVGLGPVSLTNVFNLRPPSNNLELLCEKGRPPGVEPPFSSSLTKGLYLKPEFHDQVRGLYQDLEELAPTLVVCLGNTAIWALSQQTPKVSSIRGTLWRSPLGYKCLATYHPAAVLRAWDLHPIVIADLMKAKREENSPDIKRPARCVWIKPSLRDLEDWLPKILSAPAVSIDCETKRFGRSYQITCIGFSVHPSEAFVVPFVWGMKSYWETLSDEIAAWKFVRQICTSKLTKVLQNHFFDAYVLWKVVRIPVLPPIRDTMLSHHALFPELEKSLAFQGSIYTQEPAWKLERPRGFKTEKGEEE